MDYLETNEAFRRRRHRRSDLALTYCCAVCGDKTNCYNFGVPACEGCKGFYRRHMARMGSMVCSKDGNCEINIETRKTCLACRMRKCCEAGMQRDPLTKDPVMKPRRTRAKPPGEKLRPGRKPGSKLRPKEPQTTAIAESVKQNKASSTNEAKVQPSDLTALAVEQPMSASIGDSSSAVTNTNNTFKLLASSSLELNSDMTSRNQDEWQFAGGGDNSFLAYTYLLSNPSSVCTYVSQVTGSPLSSLPPKKRKLIMDGAESSPCTSQNDIGVWGNSFAQLSARSDADSNQYFAYDTSCKVQYGYEVSNEPSSVASWSNAKRDTLAERARQFAIFLSNQPQSILRCGQLEESQRSAFHRFTRPTTIERTNDSPLGAHDLEADSLCEIPEPVYEQIMADCVNLAATMNAAWRRDELGATLYDDPHISDARYHMRYIELRIHRLVFALKRSRCFSTLTDTEKFVLIKLSLSGVVIPLVGFSFSEDCRGVVERFDDGRVIQRLVTDVVTMFALYDIDVRQVFEIVFEFNVLLQKCPLAADLPIVLAILIIVRMFQVAVEEAEFESLLPSATSEPSVSNAADDDETRARAIGVARSVFQAKVALVRREHAAFLRRFIYQRFGNSTQADEMWRFCVARILDLTEISKLVRIVSYLFFKRQPAMINTIVPVMDEVMGRMVGINNLY